MHAPEGRGWERDSEGFPGPAIKPVALRMVYEAAQAVKIPVIRAGRNRVRDRRGWSSDRRSVGGRSRDGEFLGSRRSGEELRGS